MGSVCYCCGASLCLLYWLLLYQVKGKHSTLPSPPTHNAIHHVLPSQPSDEAARRKKTDAPSPDDPQEEKPRDTKDESFIAAADDGVSDISVYVCVLIVCTCAGGGG